MISDDDLLLDHYRELDAADRARIGAALTQQPELAQRLQSLVARLDAAAAHTEIPVPEATLQRWQGRWSSEAAKRSRAQPHVRASCAPSTSVGPPPRRWRSWR